MADKRMAANSSNDNGASTNGSSHCRVSRFPRSSFPFDLGQYGGLGSVIAFQPLDIA